MLGAAEVPAGKRVAPITQAAPVLVHRLLVLVAILPVSWTFYHYKSVTWLSAAGLTGDSPGSNSVFLLLTFRNA